MSRGYRCLIIALVGWLILTAQHPDPKADHEQTRTHESVANSLSNIAATYHKETERAHSAKDDTEDCGSGKYETNADLCAQWKAADAARDSTWWAAAGTYVGGASGVLVLIALGLAYQANRIAKKAVANQLRPLLHFGDVYFASDRRILWAEIENKGAGPAINVEVHTISLTEADNSDVCAVSFGTIGAGAKRLHAFDFGEPVFFAENGLDVVALYLSYSSLHHKGRFILRGQIYSFDHRMQPSDDRATLHIKRGCPDETHEE